MSVLFLHGKASRFLFWICLLISPCLAQGPPAKNEKVIDSKFVTIGWAGQDNEIVYAKSLGNQLHRSTDGGKTWINEMYKLRMPTGDGQASAINAIFISPKNSRKAMFLSSDRVQWYTYDGGNSYQGVDSGIRFTRAVMHPTEEDWLVASAFTDACYGQDNTHPCFQELFLSTNLGKTWARVASYVSDYAWQSPTISPYSARTAYICATDAQKREGPQQFYPWDSKSHLYQTTDLFQSLEVKVEHAVGMRFRDQFFFLAMADEWEPLSLTLRVSSDNGLNFQNVEFPFKLSGSGYTILDTSEGAVFISVNHGCEGNWGNLYASDSTGTRYSLSLRAQSRQINGHVDFEKVKSVEGVYLSNYVYNVAGHRFFGDQEQKQRIVKSRITFDKGGEWHKIRPPKQTVSGSEYRESDGTPCDTVWSKGEPKSEESLCQLHFTSRQLEDEYARPKSDPNAVGLIMLNGNVGDSLQERRDALNTYLSRDGGVTWTEIAGGSNVYDMGDHGGLIVITPDDQATKTLKYSWDEGVTWASYEFADQPMEVEDIVSSPGATDRQFLIYGTREQQGVVVWVDFEPTQARLCRGAETAGQGDSDYERWTPLTQRDDCILGHKTTYVRRKQTAACYNSEQYEHTLTTENCPCDDEDYECAYGYERSGDDEEGPCELIYDVDVGPMGTEPVPGLKNIPVGCPGGQVYFINSPYQKVAGDTCNIDSLSDDFKRTHEPWRFFSCPGTRKSHPWLRWISSILIVGIISVAAVYLYRTYKDDPRLEVVWRGWSRVEKATHAYFRQYGYHRIRTSDDSHIMPGEDNRLIDDDDDIQGGPQDPPPPRPMSGRNYTPLRMAG